MWDRIRRLSAGVAGAAVLIATVTALARVAGFGRVAVFSQTVGNTCLGTAYFTANQVPTILFEIVLGGALAGMVVPVLAAAAARGEHERVSRIASALITWVLCVAVPLSALLAVFAVPVMTWLLGNPAGCDHAALRALTVRFLLVFAPQIILYALAAVCYGILQAHRRFLAPALAPLLSSLIVMGVYLAFVPLGDGYQNDLTALPSDAELVLSLGTTAGVAAMVVTVLVPLLRLRLRLRPRLSFPPGVAARVRELALAALLPLVGMQLSQLFVIALANRGGGAGALALYQYAWALFTLPYGVIAVPIATSAFTALSVRHSERDTRGYRAIVALSSRATVLITAAMATALAATARPVARVLAQDAGALPLERALLAFTPGVVGFGLVAVLSKALYASHHGRSAAAAQVAGWLAVIGCDTVLVVLAPQEWAVAALGAGTSIGLTLAAALLIAAVVRAHGRGAFAGLGRSGAAMALGAVLGYAAGAAVVHLSGVEGLWPNVGVGGIGGVASLAVFGAVAAVMDGSAVRAAVTRRLNGTDGRSETDGAVPVTAER